MAQTITGSQLRDDIDSGRTGEKVAFPDPATVPLETDAEAGGVPTQGFPQERRVVKARQEPRFSALALFLALGFAVVFVVFVSVLIGAT